MNSFKEKLFKFSQYVPNRLYPALYFFTMLYIGLIWTVNYSNFSLSVFTLLILSLPALAVHFAEPIADRPVHLSQSPFNFKNMASIISIYSKHYIIKYLKSYLLFLSILTLSLLITQFCYIAASGFSVIDAEKSLGSMLVVFALTFIVLEGVFLLFMFYPTLAIWLTYKKSLFASFREARYFFKRKFIGHMFSIVTIIVFFTPISFMGDVTIKIPYLALTFYSLYFTLVMLYISFDVASKLDSFDFNNRAKPFAFIRNTFSWKNSTKTPGNTAKSNIGKDKSKKRKK